MIKLLIFDAGDLLWWGSFRKLNSRMKMFFEDHDVDGSVVDARWKKVFKDVSTGKMSYDEAIGIEFEGMGLNKKAKKEWSDIHTKDIIDYYSLHPYVKTTLKKLQKRYKITILTDEVRGAKFKRAICKKLGVDVFDKVFCSCEIGYEKPHKKAFFTVLNHFNIRPCETVFVGHSQDEVEGARKLGIRTIAIRWDKKTKSDFYIKSFLEIPKILEKM